ncbi:ATP-binding protein [Streptomyces sp. NPDC048111]|uniref:ATP-binding protein n=1 Tax=Streptomyces sp. NPDC048111 TaxID=3365500 RepID=UPI003716082C
MATVVAEFAANAITHGRTPGGDFEVRLALAADLVRIEVADTRHHRFPRNPRRRSPPRTAVPVQHLRRWTAPRRGDGRPLGLVRTGQLRQDRPGRSAPAAGQ